MVRCAFDNVFEQRARIEISAAVLATATKQLAFVAALGQRANESRTSRFRMATVLFEYERELLADELRARHSALAGGARE